MVALHFPKVLYTFLLKPEALPSTFTVSGHIVFTLQAENQQAEQQPASMATSCF